jgi:hypothetical protein
MAESRYSHIRFLKLRVEILKGRLPGNRVILGSVDRRRLIMNGAEVKHQVKDDPLDIVSIRD